MTERFLWDIRRVQADLLADNYYGEFRNLCNQYGLVSYCEPYDRGPMEELQIGSRVDGVMGEFLEWVICYFPEQLDDAAYYKIGVFDSSYQRSESGGCRSIYF